MICIAFHFDESRLPFLAKVLQNIAGNYKCDYGVYIDTNTTDFGKYAKEFELAWSHKLAHPFHLTWMHREHMIEEIDNYDYFMYIEDDMLVPWENVLNYIENFKLLWDKGFVPSFIRVEEKNGEQFVTDITKQQKASPYAMIGGKSFIALDEPYHAFWIMPQKELKESMRKDFFRLSDSREGAASYPMADLGRKPLVEVEIVNDKYEVSPKCHSFHISNTYVNGDSNFAKIKLENIFL